MRGFFEDSVFINCPFDDNYRTLLKPLIFTIRHCGLLPRIASERLDSSEIRLDKIIELILDCHYSIHDLSRIRSEKRGEYYRLNMPLEIGLDLGCKAFHRDGKYQNKKFLLLEGERFSTQKALSDLSGVDVKCHNNEPEQLVEVVRTWFVETGRAEIAGPNRIWDDYNVFYADLYETYLQEGFKANQIDTLPIVEFLDFIDSWLLDNGRV
jgi:hypothetical protein